MVDPSLPLAPEEKKDNRGMILFVVILVGGAFFILYELIKDNELEDIRRAYELKSMVWQEKVERKDERYADLLFYTNDLRERANQLDADNSGMIKTIDKIEKEIKDEKFKNTGLEEQLKTARSKLEKAKTSEEILEAFHDIAESLAKDSTNVIDSALFPKNKADLFGSLQVAMQYELRSKKEGLTEKERLFMLNQALEHYQAAGKLGFDCAEEMERIQKLLSEVKQN